MDTNLSPWNNLFQKQSTFYSPAVNGGSETEFGKEGRAQRVVKLGTGVGGRGTGRWRVGREKGVCRGEPFFWAPSPREEGVWCLTCPGVALGTLVMHLANTCSVLTYTKQVTLSSAGVETTSCLLYVENNQYLKSLSLRFVWISFMGPPTPPDIDGAR